MGKRNYTHVQALLPEIKTMLAEGKTRQEVAEHYGFQDKQVVKKLLERERARQRNWRPESYRGLRAGQGNLPYPEMLCQSRHTRSSVYRWKTSCCGIFCNSQEGSEAEDKIPHHISPQRRVSGVRYVCFLCRIQKRLLCFRPAPWQA